LIDLSELKEAKKCFERALSIDQNVYGFDDPKVARDFKGLGLVLRDMHDLQGAEKCFEKALDIYENDEKTINRNNPDTMIVRNYLDSLDL
jgi:tetratricopeptide (TPR) repeat protein